MLNKSCRSFFFFVVFKFLLLLLIIFCSFGFFVFLVFVFFFAQNIMSLAFSVCCSKRNNQVTSILFNEISLSILRYDCNFRQNRNANRYIASAGNVLDWVTMIYLPLLPTPCAPKTAIFTSESEDFFRRIPRVVISIFFFDLIRFYTVH